MFFSLGLRCQFGVLDNRDAEQGVATVDDPAELLRNMVEGVNSLNLTLTSIGDTIVRCFRSEEEYSLLSQLKLIRTEMSDLRREVTKSLEDFGKKVAELGAEAIIESLRTVIEQFNAKLSDLVGAEFKQLKEAMVKLVDWQEQHRQSVDRMQGQLDHYLSQLDAATQMLEHASKTIATTSDHLDSIDGTLVTISSSAVDLGEHAKVLNTQNTQLAALLEQIQTLGAEAKTVLPQIATHLNEATRSLSMAAENSQTQFEETGQAMVDTVTAGCSTTT